MGNCVKLKRIIKLSIKTQDKTLCMGKKQTLHKTKYSNDIQKFIIVEYWHWFFFFLVLFVYVAIVDFDGHFIVFEKGFILKCWHKKIQNKTSSFSFCDWQQVYFRFTVTWGCCVVKGLLLGYVTLAWTKIQINMHAWHCQT